jgi:transcriptional regulator with XRE-family HTH domain
MSSAVARKLGVICDRAGVNSREVAELLGTAPETVSRWRKGRAEPQRDKLERLLELEWLADQLGDVYPSPGDARMWLLSRHRLLGGDTPASRIEKGKIEDVLALIAQIRDGAYV